MSFDVLKSFETDRGKRKQRPTSATSTKSILSFSSTTTMKFEGRGFGYFGDDDEKIRTFRSKILETKGMRVPEQRGISDEKGCLTFLDLPIGLYTINVDYS
jgi:hypothetical protein